jgi:hypothetical protein
VVAAAETVTRSEVIGRAQTWFNPPVPYDMYGRGPGGYRADCSAYVSMAWKLPAPGLDTVSMPNVAHRISKDDLKPGDVLLNGGPGTGGVNGHVAIFEKWASADRSSYWAYEQAPPRTQHRVISYPYDGNDTRFLPYRYNNIVDDRQEPAYLPEMSDGVPSTVNTGHGIVTFAMKPDGVLMHRWQNADGGAWSSWTPLGTNLTGRTTALIGGNGKLVVFAREKGTGRVLHTWQDNNGAWAQNWVPLGDRTFAGDPSVVRNPATGLLAVFARDTQGRLMHTWQDPNGAWVSDWQDFGRELGTINGDPVALTGGNGKLVVFARDRFNNLVHTWQDGNGAWNQSWIGLGRKLGDDPTVVLNPRTKDLVVFGRDEQGRLIHTWQNSGAWAPDWVDSGTTVKGRPTVLSRQDTGRLIVIVRDEFDNITHSWQDTNGAWNGSWIGLHHKANEDVSAVLGPNNKLAVFARDDVSNTVVHTWQKPDGSWNESWVAHSDFPVTS